MHVHRKGYSCDILLKVDLAKYCAMQGLKVTRVSAADVAWSSDQGILKKCSEMPVSDAKGGASEVAHSLNVSATSPFE